MTKTHPFVLLLVILICSCSDPSGQGPAVDTSKLIPLTVGNSWRFSVTYFDTLGNVSTSSMDTLTVTGDTVLGQFSWTRPVNGRFLYFGTAGLLNTDSGVVVRALVPSSRPGPLTRYRFPALKGDSYGYPEMFQRVPDVYLIDTLSSLTILSTDTLVAVPAGAFHCIQYRWAALAEHWYPKDFVIDYFLSPGFGWIRAESYDGNFRVRSIQATGIHLSQ